jgi:predicted 2-oxoglutarate/Fe(II)-dependent dioxygenase YbiX
LQRFGFAGPWWTVAAASLAGPAPDVGDAAAHAAYKKKVKRLRSTLEEQLEESHQLLAVGLQHRHRLSAAQYRPLLDVEFFAAVAGTVELGIVPITFESPLTRYCRALTVAPRGDQARALTALRPVVEAAAVRTGVKLDDQGEPTQARRPDAARKASTSSDDGDDDDGEGGGGGKRARIDAAPASAADLQSASGIRWDDAPERVAASLATLAPAIFSGVEGVAMGATASMLNHSCVPNCQVDTAAGGMLALVPLCDVAAGSELLIAYTATAAPRAVRHAELRKHRFTCGCSRCAFDAAAEAGPPALELSLTALPPPALLALGRQAQEEGRHETAETLFAALSARAGEAASAGIAVGEAEHALGVSRLALGRWSAAHAAWADGARAAPEHPALQAQAAKDGSYWPAPNAPYDEVTHGPAAAPAFTLVPLGAGSSPAVLTAAPLLDAAGCARVVAAAEAAASSGGGWTTARHYDVPTTDMPLHTIPPLLRWFNGALRRSIAPLLAAAYPGVVFAGRVRVHDAFVVRYDAAAQRHLPVHRDQSVFSLTIALNPRAEFEGGGTYFADARTVVCPDAGHVLAFSGETRHGGEPITAGVRYIIAAFLYIADNE